MSRLILLLFLLAPSLRATDRWPFEFRRGIVEILGDASIHTVLPTGSMKPALDENNLLLVRMEPWENLRTGDIFLYQRGDSVIVHAVWARSSNGTAIIAKGFANHNVDPALVFKEQYRGLVVGIIRRDIVEKVLTSGRGMGQ